MAILARGSISCLHDTRISYETQMILKRGDSRPQPDVRLGPKPVLKFRIFAPTGPKHGSPGQRPGFRDGSRVVALKGNAVKDFSA
jgi:hypothetical protein